MKTRATVALARSESRSERGAALVFALLGLAALTVLGLGLTGLGIGTTISTANEQDRAEALAIADAGIAHARKLILWQEWASLDQFLANGDGVACNGDELASAPAGPLPAGYPTAASDFIPQAGRPYGRGSYRVVVCDDDATDWGTDPVTSALVQDLDPNHDADRTIIVRATGVGPNGAVATVEQIFGATDLPAIDVNGNLRIPGSPRIMGPAGTAHANGDVQIDGNPCAQESFSAVGSATVSGASAGGGATCLPSELELRPDSPPVPVPTISPNTYKAAANYWLENDGTARDPATNLVVPAPPGWTWETLGKKWVSGSNIPGGTYWINANVVMGGNPGQTTALGLPLTILSNGYVSIAGNPKTAPNLLAQGLGAGGASVKVAVITSNDLQLQGNSSVTFSGLYYADHQLDVSGNPSVTGQLLARNAADTPSNPMAPTPCGSWCLNLVPLVTGAMEITGSPTVNFSGIGIAGTRALGWRECRTDTDPANPCGALFVF